MSSGFFVGLLLSSLAIIDLIASLVISNQRHITLAKYCKTKRQYQSMLDESSGSRLIQGRSSLACPCFCFGDLRKILLDASQFAEDRMFFCIDLIKP